MTYKNNHIKEDLIRAFKVFDTNDDKVVKRDELKSVFLNLIGKHIVTESQLDAMFQEAMEQLGHKEYLLEVKETWQGNKHLARLMIQTSIFK